MIERRGHDTTNGGRRPKGRRDALPKKGDGVSYLDHGNGKPVESRDGNAVLIACGKGRPCTKSIQRDCKHCRAGVCE